MEERDRIISIACSIAGISRDEFDNKRTYLASKAKVIVCRHLEDEGMSHKQIAQLLGKPRSTVTCQINGFRLDYKYDKRFKQIYDQFKEKINTEKEEK